MNKLIISLVLLALAGYVVVQWSQIYKTKTDLDKQVEEQLNFVNDSNQSEIRTNLVNEARKLGVELSPDNIRIAYEDTDVRSVAQSFTAKIATFVNKRVTIQLHYTARLVGISLRQDIEESRIRQIQAQERENPQKKQILDGIQ